MGISIAIVFGKGFEVADDWAALFSSGIILYNGYRILRPALGEIMDEQLDSELIEQIRAIWVNRQISGCKLLYLLLCIALTNLKGYE